VSGKLHDFKRYLASDDELPSEELTFDPDELVHDEENEDAPPAMPPESLEDFEKAIRGERERGLPRIPPAPPD
jgi:hypothetical protein